MAARFSVSSHVNDEVPHLPENVVIGTLESNYICKRVLVCMPGGLTNILDSIDSTRLMNWFEYAKISLKINKFQLRSFVELVHSSYYFPRAENVMLKLE